MLFLVKPDIKSVHLLADLLETIQVTIDEMMELRPEPAKTGGTSEAFGANDPVYRRAAAIRDFVERLSTHELAILCKLEQARVRARRVSRTDWRLRSLMTLFLTGTQMLADRLPTLATPTADAFNRGDLAFTFLKARGLLAADCTALDTAPDLTVTDAYRLCGLIALKDLLDHCESTLNAIDAQYDLYQWNDDLSQEAEVVPLGRIVPITASEPAALSEAEPSSGESAPAIVAGNAEGGVVPLLETDKSPAEPALSLDKPSAPEPEAGGAPDAAPELASVPALIEATETATTEATNAAATERASANRMDPAPDASPAAIPVLASVASEPASDQSKSLAERLAAVAEAESVAESVEAA
jgi:hypothetical protein